MPGSNLTRVDAAARAELIRVESYEIELDLTDGNGKPGEKTFSSRTTARFTCTQPGAETFVDLVAATIHSATLNGSDVDTTTYQSKSGIPLVGLAAENELVVHADCVYMNTGEGLHRFVDPVDDEVYLFSQSETRDAHRIYTCFDQPDLKASVTYHVTAPAHWTVVSNSPVSSVEEKDGAKVWHFEPTPRVPTYITAIVAGPYHEVRDEHRGIPLGIFCRQSLAAHLDPDDIFEVTRQGLDFYEEKFDYPYPFAKYDQLFVPELNAGAMENAGCVTFTEDLVFRSKVTRLRYEVRANTILHEMAHMWFGDLVTMKWWDDLWLNESFAEWAAHWSSVEATRYTEAWTTFCTQRKAWGYRQDQLSSTHPIAADMYDVEAVETNFDGITYAKGGSTLKQLVAYVGEDEFVAALRAYFKAHEWGNSTLADLLGALEEASGRDLSNWAEIWLQTSSVNTLRPEFTVDDDGNFTSFAVLQEAPAEYPTLRPHRIAIGLYERNAAGVLSRWDRVEVDVDGARTELPQLVGVRKPALVLLNDDDLAYTKIRLDPDSMAAVVSDIARIDSSLARGLCWGAAWDMNRDAELATRDFVRLAVNGLPTETAMSVVQIQLGMVIRALELYADPSWAPEGYRMLCDAAWSAAQAVESGSDVQLVWVRAFAASARTPEQLEIVKELLHGTRTLGGLTVDTDLRWHLLENLVAQGVAGEEEIAAELKRDPTDQGRRNAATSRALVPTEQAKAEAWHLITEEELPNQTVIAVLQGFSYPGHAALLAPYVEKYFDAARDAFNDRTSEVADNIAQLAYPVWDVSEATVTRTEEYLANNELPYALKRSLNEGKDAVVRALKARACDTRAAANV